MSHILIALLTHSTRRRKIHPFIQLGVFKTEQIQNKTRKLKPQKTAFSSDQGRFHCPGLIDFFYTFGPTQKPINTLVKRNYWANSLVHKQKRAFQEKKTSLLSALCLSLTLTLTLSSLSLSSVSFLLQ